MLVCAISWIFTWRKKEKNLRIFAGITDYSSRQIALISCPSPPSPRDHAGIYTTPCRCQNTWSSPRGPSATNPLMQTDFTWFFLKSAGGQSSAISISASSRIPPSYLHLLRNTGLLQNCVTFICFNWMRWTACLVNGNTSPWQSLSYSFKINF